MESPPLFRSVRSSASARSMRHRPWHRLTAPGTGAFQAAQWDAKTTLRHLAKRFDIIEERSMRRYTCLYIHIHICMYVCMFCIYMSYMYRGLAIRGLGVQPYQHRSLAGSLHSILALDSDAWDSHPTTTFDHRDEGLLLLELPQPPVKGFASLDGSSGSLIGSNIHIYIYIIKIQMISNACPGSPQCSFCRGKTRPVLHTASFHLQRAALGLARPWHL